MVVAARKPNPDAVRSKRSTQSTYLLALKLCVAALFVGLGVSVYSMHQSDIGLVHHERYEPTPTDVPAYLRIADHKSQHTQPCGGYGTPDDKFMELLGGVWCSDSKFVQRVANQGELREVRIILKAFNATESGQVYAQRYWGLHAQEPVSMQLLRNHSRFAPIIGEDVRVMVWDPSKFALPSSVARTQEHSLKHVIYALRVGQVFVCVKAKGNIFTEVETVAAIVIAIKKHIEDAQPAPWELSLRSVLNTIVATTIATESAVRAFVTNPTVVWYSSALLVSVVAAGLASFAAKDHVPIIVARIAALFAKKTPDVAEASTQVSVSRSFFSFSCRLASGIPVLLTPTLQPSWANRRTRDPNAKSSNTSEKARSTGEGKAPSAKPVAVHAEPLGAAATPAEPSTKAVQVQPATGAPVASVSAGAVSSQDQPKAGKGKKPKRTGSTRDSDQETPAMSLSTEPSAAPGNAAGEPFVTLSRPSAPEPSSAIPATLKPVGVIVSQQERQVERASPPAERISQSVPAKLKEESRSEPPLTLSDPPSSSTSTPPSERRFVETVHAPLAEAKAQPVQKPLAKPQSPQRRQPQQLPQQQQQQQ
eukprot:m.427495 g.427495  ORF g.427495 m.427495 type:complete len:592 (+) comp56700_c0_seq4:131-1906(+)